jgi:uncharacterized protein YndB with AHSA1/START domain
MTDHGRRKHVGRTVRKEVLIRASPEQVWEAWALPERISQWFVDGAEGEMRAGQVVTWRFEHFHARLPLQVYEAERGHFLAFGGETPNRPNALQEVFVEHEGGLTRLRLANSGFHDGAQGDEEYEGVESGWEMALATLKFWLEHTSGEPRTHLLSMRPARFEYAPLQPLYDTASGLSSWLANDVSPSAGPLRLGTRVAMTLPGGERLTGEVLARTPRELLLSWSERNAVLGLKCFSMGPMGRAVALDFNAWPLAEDQRRDMQALLDSALERLVARLS